MLHTVQAGTDDSSVRVCIAQEQIFTTSTSTDGDRDSLRNIRHQLHIDISDCPTRQLHTIAMKASNQDMLFDLMSPFL